LAAYINYRGSGFEIEDSPVDFGKNQKEIQFKKLFKLTIPVLAIVLFILAVGGHFLKAHLREKLLMAQDQLYMIDKRKNTILSLEQELAQKEAIYNESGFKSFGYFSKRISQITNSVHPEVILAQLECQPLTGTIRSDKKVELIPNQIRVKGLCYRDSDFKAWISEMENINWVASITIEDYHSNREGMNDFNLIIDLN